MQLKKTLHTEILFWLLSFTVSSILVLAFSNFYSLYKKNEIDNVVQEVNQLHLLCLKDFKLHNDFINHESINPLYFITGRSKLLRENKCIDDSIQSIINNIEKQSLTKNAGCSPHLKHANNYFRTYEKTFDTIAMV